MICAWNCRRERVDWWLLVEVRWFISALPPRRKRRFLGLESENRSKNSQRRLTVRVNSFSFVLPLCLLIRTSAAHTVGSFIFLLERAEKSCSEALLLAPYALSCMHKNLTQCFPGRATRIGFLLYYWAVHQASWLHFRLSQGERLSNGSKMLKLCYLMKFRHVLKAIGACWGPSF